jgi:Phytanoyl-CoA dioxygenase (PhyH)
MPSEAAPSLRGTLAPGLADGSDYRGCMRELVDSSAFRADPDRLRDRLAADGYLFLRGLLPAADVHAAQAGVTAELTRGGWIDSAGHPAGPRRALEIREALADPVFRAAFISRGLNRLPYLAPLRPLVRSILGPGAFSYPVKVLRTVNPQGHSGDTRGRYVHQDYANSGVQDMLTTWLPLMDIPVRLGGLAVLPGSHLGPPVRPRLLRPGEHGWATTDFRPGDVLLFHCLTAHAALPNLADTMRISTDCRWQRADQPAPADMVLGPVRTPGGRQVELFSRMFAREPWWEPVPPGLAIRPREELARAGAPPAPSRFFGVHRRWARWRPPGGDLR